MAEPALFRRFPALAGPIPHHAFLAGPTPVAPLEARGLPPGRVFVKHDEHCGPHYGGNKPRKLEFLIGGALARGARRLVTSGGLGTHHGLATTILGRTAGLATTLLLVDQPRSDEVRASLRQFAAWDADVVDGRTVAGAAARGAVALSRAWLRGEHPVLIPTGGSSPLGTLGMVSAALELGEQVRAGALPPPAELFVAVGSGGSVAGLVLGLRLADLPTRVRGVLVTDILPPSPRKLARLAKRALALLRRADPSLPAPALAEAEFELAERQLGPGYGAATEAARSALAVAGEAGLQLETTYTAKCFAELLARSREGALPDAPILFWNTFNAVDTAARAPAAPRPDALPPRLREFAGL